MHSNAGTKSFKRKSARHGANRTIDKIEPKDMKILEIILERKLTQGEEKDKENSAQGHEEKQR